MRQGEGKMRALFLGLSVVMLAFPAQSGAEIVWVDATGCVIAPLVGAYFAEGAVYMDDAGHFWSLDANLATTSVSYTGTLYFAEPGCKGPAYVGWALYFLARDVIGIYGVPGAWVRRDDAVFEVISPRSWDYGAGCEHWNGNVPVVAASAVMEVASTPPYVGVPPLHVERRDPK